LHDALVIKLSDIQIKSTMDDVVVNIRKRICSKIALNREQAVHDLQSAIKTNGTILDLASTHSCQRTATSADKHTNYAFNRGGRSNLTLDESRTSGLATTVIRSVGGAMRWLHARKGRSLPPFM